MEERKNMFYRGSARRYADQNHLATNLRELTRMFKGCSIITNVENVGVVCAGLEISDALRAIPDALSRFSDALKIVCDGLGLC
jgi:hypothetical protein